MRILIDADGCPVVNCTVQLAARYGVACVIFCDTAHSFSYPGVQTVVVPTGADSADFRLVNEITHGDLVITQDYGLAAMCLAKGAQVLQQDGHSYTAENIDGLLAMRHVSKQIRNAGGRTKAIPKRKTAQNRQFSAALEAVLKSQTQ